MTDYYGILRSAIDETGADTADARATIYLRAWAALEAQFDSPEVSLPDDARKQQRQLMDEAISRIERESGATEQEASEAAAALDKETDVPPAPAAGPEPDGASVPSEGRMADQAIPDSDAAAPWRPQADGGPAADPAPPSGPQTGNSLSGSAPARDSARRGRGGLIAAIIVLLLIAAGTAGAWWRWDDVQSLMAQVGPDRDMAGEQSSETQQAVVDTDDEAEPPAAAQESEPADPPATAAGKQQAQQRGGQVDAPAAPAGESDSAAAPAAQEPADASSEPDETARQAQDTAGEASKDQDRIDDTGAVVERAYLIQESEQSGAEDLRFAGQARWSVEGEGAATVLSIDMQVPERSVALRVTMRENDDAALPASHTIDLVYQGPNDSPNLQDVAGIMTIHDTIENAEPLRAAGALVVPGQYLLALRGAQDDRAENMERLTNAKWLAVRAQFDDSKHAVFLIEKAEQGSAVLDEALTAWGDSQTGSAQ